jgi:hypothetical protein
VVVQSRRVQDLAHCGPAKNHRFDAQKRRTIAKMNVK